MNTFQKILASLTVFTLLVLLFAGGCSDSGSKPVVTPDELVGSWANTEGNETWIFPEKGKVQILTNESYTIVSDSLHFMDWDYNRTGGDSGPSIIGTWDDGDGDVWIFRADGTAVNRIDGTLLFDIEYVDHGDYLAITDLMKFTYGTGTLTIHIAGLSLQYDYSIAGSALTLDDGYDVIQFTKE